MGTTRVVRGQLGATSSIFFTKGSMVSHSNIGRVCLAARRAPTSGWIVQ